MSSSGSRSVRAHLFPTGLSIPDINVWLALAAPEYPHHSLAEQWWRRQVGRIAFVRLRFYDDDRVTFVPEPSDAEKRFREKAVGRTASPKFWADTWMLAMASAAGEVLVTFDRALAAHGSHCLLSTKA
jgi:predicted nucleic acid-binding protein